MPYNLITILGPTAAGKTKLSTKLASNFNGEIISADSRQVYKKLDVGTGKDYNDYIVDNKNIPYHLIDIIEPQAEYNLFSFQNDFYKTFDLINFLNKTPFLVGGTGLYLSSIIQNYDLKEAEFHKEDYDELLSYDIEKLKIIYLELNPNPHNTTDILDKERLITAILIFKNKNRTSKPKQIINSLNIGINIPRDKLKENITKRLKQRLENNMIDEVKNLIDGGVSYNRLISLGLEYKFIALYIRDEINYNDMYQKLNSAIYDFAKRQIKWFRKMEREGVKINWIDGPDFKKSKEIINKNYFSK